MAKYHIRIPIKAVAVFNLDYIPGEPEFSRQLRDMFECDKFIMSCWQFLVDERAVVQVCEECGAELFGDEDHEIGVCSECYGKIQSALIAEQKHPDNKGAI